MFRVLDVSFNANTHLSDPCRALELHKEGYGYLSYLKDSAHIAAVQHLNFEGVVENNGIRFHFLKRKNVFRHFPVRSILYIKRLQPDIIIAQGMIFPLQVALTRLLLGRKVRIIVQHHGELPGKGLKKQAAKIADVFVNAYFFTAAENAFPWKVAGIIPARKKCFEILEASTYLQGKDPASSKKLLGFTAKHNFLWVGRLNSNKDPLTVLKGFHQFSKVCTDVTLYMIYQTEELLSQIQNFVDSTPSLKKKVVLVGKIPHDQMETWFSAANYYLSASRKEGSGYALLEAMACGCVPIISAIPPFRKITMNGKYGFLFEPGNEGSLLDAMFTAISHNSKEYIGAITHHFRSRLSFQAIASSMLEAFQELASKSALNESAAASIK